MRLFARFERIAGDSVRIAYLVKPPLTAKAGFQYVNAEWLREEIQSSTISTGEWFCVDLIGSASKTKANEDISSFKVEKDSLQILEGRQENGTQIYTLTGTIVKDWTYTTPKHIQYVCVLETKEGQTFKLVYFDGISNPELSKWTVAKPLKEGDVVSVNTMIGVCAKYDQTTGDVLKIGGKPLYDDEMYLFVIDVMENNSSSDLIKEAQASMGGVIDDMEQFTANRSIDSIFDSEEEISEMEAADRALEEMMSGDQMNVIIESITGMSSKIDEAKEAAENALNKVNRLEEQQTEFIKAATQHPHKITVEAKEVKAEANDETELSLEAFERLCKLADSCSKTEVTKVILQKLKRARIRE